MEYNDTVVYTIPSVVVSSSDWVVVAATVVVAASVVVVGLVVVVASVVVGATVVVASSFTKYQNMFITTRSSLYYLNYNHN